LRIPTFCALFALVVALLWGADRFLLDMPSAEPLSDAVCVMAMSLAGIILLATFPGERDDIHRLPLLLQLAVTLVLGAGLAYWVYLPTNPTATVAAAAATLATVGWLVQRDASMFLNRKQHTLNILLQMRQSEIFNRHRIGLFARFPAGRKIEPADLQPLLDERRAREYGIVDGKLKFPTIESINFLANFYEFLAAAIRQKDLDEELLYATIGDMATNYYDKIRPYIEDAQEPGPDGVPTTDTFVEYYWLYQRWTARTLAEAAQRARRRSGPA
jgi:Domain of unknown function (DUF4760)